MTVCHIKCDTLLHYTKMLACSEVFVKENMVRALVPWHYEAEERKNMPKISDVDLRVQG